MKNIRSRFSYSILSFSAGTITAISGIIVLLGWHLDLVLLKTFGLGTVTMKPNAAVLFLFAGIALILLQFSHPISKLISRIFSLLILSVGILTLAEFSFNLNFGIDELIYTVSDTTGFILNPSRITVNAALSFVLIGIVFSFLSLWCSRSNFFIEFCSVAIFSISAIGFLGFVFGLSDAAGVTRYSRMAVIAAILFIVLFVGIFSTFRLRFKTKISIEQKLFAGLTLTTGVFLFIVLLLLSNNRLMHEADDLVQESLKAKEEIVKIDNAVSSMSNSGRGYLILGNEAYLDRIKRPKNEIADNIKTLRKITSKNSILQKAMRDLEPLIKNRFELTRQFIEIRKTKESQEEMLALLTNGRGEAINDSIFSVTSKMIEEEDRMLALCNASENYRSKQVMIAVKIGFLFQVFLLLLIFILLRKDINRRRESEVILNQMNEDLEDRILERTAALQKSEKKYRAIFENIQDVFSQTNLAGIVLEISPSVKYFSEFDREEIIGNPVDNLYYNPDDRIGLLEVILKKGEIFDYEIRIKTKSNQLKYVSINARLIFDSDNRPDHIDGITRDITQRKQSESQLELLSWAIEQSPVTIVVTDKDGAIEYINPKFTEVTGYSFEEVRGKNPRILQSGYHSREFYNELWDTILLGKEWYGEFYNKKKSGELYWERAIISNIVNLQGEISSFISIREDITERKKMMEDFLKAKEQAEESNKLKAAFLNNISHEIRTPFTGILGFLSALQEEGLTISERAEYIGIINKSAYKFMNTINNIAEMSQIHADQTVLNISETSIDKLTDELFERFKTEVESKGLQLTINNDAANYIEWISTDIKKLNAILDILIDNAIKFTNAGSIELNIRKNKNYLEFSIKDTGIGIPENKLQAIFEPFRQADGSTTRQFEGLGLGLTIAKAYVEMLGGTILIESEEGKGSTFRFTIPCQIEQN